MRSGGDELAYNSAFDDIEGVYLEDSWVLSVTASLTVVALALDLVLTRAHDSYRAPLLGDAYCYRQADLRVESDSAIRVHLSGLRQRSTPVVITAYAEALRGPCRSLLGGDAALWERLRRQRRARIAANLRRFAERNGEPW